MAFPIWNLITSFPHPGTAWSPRPYEIVRYFGVCTDGTYLYFGVSSFDDPISNSSIRIYRTDMDGSNPTYKSISLPYAGRIFDLTYYNGYIYILSKQENLDDTPGVFRCTWSGSLSTVCSSLDDYRNNYCFCYCPDDGYFYWGDYWNEELQKTSTSDLCTSTPTVVVNASVFVHGRDGMCYEEEDNHLLIADIYNRRIWMYTTAGERVGYQICTDVGGIDAYEGYVYTVRSSTVYVYEIRGHNWYVTPTGAGVKNGRDWENAFDNVDAAMRGAQDGDIINISYGTYNNEPLNNALSPVNAGQKGIKIIIKNTDETQSIGSVVNIEINRT